MTTEDHSPERRIAEYHVSEKTIHGMSNSIHENGMRLKELNGKFGEMDRGLKDNTNVTIQLEKKFNTMEQDLRGIAQTLNRIDTNTSEVVTSYTNFQGFTKTVKWITITITPIVTFAIWAKHNLTTWLK